MNKQAREIVEVEEPDWGLLMFWEDITYLFQLIAQFFKKLING